MSRPPLPLPPSHRDLRPSIASGQTSRGASTERRAHFAPRPDSHEPKQSGHAVPATSKSGGQAARIAQELADARVRESQLRETLASERAQHADAIRRLEVKLELNAKANRAKSLEVKLRATREELAVAQVSLETAASTEQALRSELAVFQQALDWHDHPELRRAAESTVKVREVTEAHAAASERAAHAEARVEELTSQLETWEELGREYEEVQASLEEELDQHKAAAGEAVGALEENAALRGRVAELEAGYETAAQELDELRPEVDQLRKDVSRFRLSWQECREQAEEDAVAKERAEEACITEKAERKAAEDSLRDAERQVSLGAVEIASLRRQEVRWHDDQQLLAEARTQLAEAERRAATAEQRARALDELANRAEEERAADRKRSTASDERAAKLEEALTTLKTEHKRLSEEFDALERQAGRRAFVAEKDADEAKRDLAACRRRVSELTHNNDLLTAKNAALRSEAAAAARRVPGLRAALDQNAGTSPKTRSPHYDAEQRWSNRPSTTATSSPSQGDAAAATQVQPERERRSPGPTPTLTADAAAGSPDGINVSGGAEIDAPFRLTRNINVSRARATLRSAGANAPATPPRTTHNRTFDVSPATPANV